MPRAAPDHEVTELGPENSGGVYQAGKGAWAFQAGHSPAKGPGT